KNIWLNFRQIERGQRQALRSDGASEPRLFARAQINQSHQKSRSTSSASPMKNQISEKPYRAAHSLAGPPSSFAQARSSSLKNWARWERTLSVSRSFCLPAFWLSSALIRPLGLSGSAPRK